MPRLPRYDRQSPGVRCINFLCAVLLTLVLVTAIIFFVMWLSLRPHRPKFALTDFDVQYANRQSGLANLPMRFSVNEHNPNSKIGIHYEAIYASVYYNDQLIASGPAGNGPFFEVPKGSTAVQGSLTATGPTPSDAAWPRFAGELSAGSVAMRLVLSSTVRFQVKIWDTRVHHMKVECDFKIGGDGTLQHQQRDNNSGCAVYF
ncbi:hypothetical protein PR202_ga29750 [Eleusine coracana subsp. coracana]|uniref:Late embryogenesis abundant protein LEA-2 subgroup domain-containing protein n=1 Tax=Eleusine coracana subsp. coracana TaxID=191504 RepID=A0AAV5DM83_ELECO|nr:hypothetical protein QOZ80_7AG0570070 [Eleusine coracana subsp. coracana]GJN11551.1 hypothetical protein PR202_ga29750 [Eleusine coracana subsp. coracana]